ncbi:MAG: transposase [Planctomycetota bacterium]
MNFGDPIVFFLTWVTYGTWLPGDDRAWVEYQHGWQLPCRDLEADCETRMNEGAVRFTKDQRRRVEEQIAETCEHRGWQLHAVNCRSNHVHAVVSSKQTPPKKIRTDLKAYATRCLKSLDASRDNWWAERGSIRLILTEDDLDTVITYVNDAQDRKPDA